MTRYPAYWVDRHHQSQNLGCTYVCTITTLLNRYFTYLPASGLLFGNSSLHSLAKWCIAQRQKLSSHVASFSP